MYYKVINKESEVYKKLCEQRKKEVEADERNRKKMEELLGFSYKSFYGKRGFQSIFRVDTYTAFVPEDGETITKAVCPSSDYNGAYEPNRRTKSGKELYDFLHKRREAFSYHNVLVILGCDDVYSSFNVPFMDVVNDVVLLFLDEKHNPASEDVIEITRKEFDSLLKNEPN